MSKGLKIFCIVAIVVAFIGLCIWYLISANSQSSSQPVSITTVPSSAKLINSFSFMGLIPEVDGAVDNTNYTINLLVPSGTDLTKLIPTISISDGATVSPNSGVTQDFTNPVIYTVTAEDKSTQSYTVTVTTGTLNQSTSANTPPSSQNAINSFSFMGLTPEVDGVVDTNEHTVNLTVPVGTDVTNLVPTISVSDGATIYPYSGVTQDFTNPVIYTVTAEDGTIQDYTVTVNTAQTPTQTPAQ